MVSRVVLIGVSIAQNAHNDVIGVIIRNAVASLNPSVVFGLVVVDVSTIQREHGGAFGIVRHFAVAKKDRTLTQPPISSCVMKLRFVARKLTIAVFQIVFTPSSLIFVALSDHCIYSGHYLLWFFVTIPCVPLAGVVFA